MSDVVDKVEKLIRNNFSRDDRCGPSFHSVAEEIVQTVLEKQRNDFPEMVKFREITVYCPHCRWGIIIIVPGKLGDNVIDCPNCKKYAGLLVLAFLPSD